MWNNVGLKGRDRYAATSRELEQKYFRLGPTYTKVSRFENTNDSALAVLEYFAKRHARAQLLLAADVERLGSSLSGVRKTAAGKAIMKGSNSSCVIL
jgi:hypothetical protein